MLCSRASPLLEIAYPRSCLTQFLPGFPWGRAEHAACNNAHVHCDAVSLMAFETFESKMNFIVATPATPECRRGWTQPLYERWQNGKYSDKRTELQPAHASRPDGELGLREFRTEARCCELLINEFEKCFANLDRNEDCLRIFPIKP